MKPVYNQLTPDQLRYLYLVDSNYIYSGETEELTRTVQFLKNGQKIINATVTTGISDARTSALVSTNRFNVHGSSELDISEEDLQLVSVEVRGSSSEYQRFQSLAYC